MAEQLIGQLSEKTRNCVQYEQFTNFFGDAVELSNTIELWDAIPKYAVSARTQNALRSIDSRLPVHEQCFTYVSCRSGKRIESVCRVEIQPASIKIKDEGYVDFYPSTDEELVEEVIRKIFADQNCGLHDPTNTESWVRFSVQKIRRELKARGKTRSLDEIKRSIEILSKTHVSLFVDDTDVPLYSAPILSDLIRVTRQKYLEDSSMTWVARLPALISKSVNELTYRQFNYGVLMSLSSQLARWLHKRLSHNYSNASHFDTYQTLYSSIQRDSGLLTYSRTNDNLKSLERALDELQERMVLSTWERAKESREGRKLVDVKYTLHAHSNFIKDIKAANARLKESRATLSASSVDKLLSSGRQTPQ